jgi:hypothetical protein
MDLGDVRQAAMSTTKTVRNKLQKSLPMTRVRPAYVEEEEEEDPDADALMVT